MAEFDVTKLSEELQRLFRFLQMGDYVYVAVDGANFEAAQERLPQALDYDKLYTWFCINSKLFRFDFFIAEDEKYRSKLTWLRLHGFNVITRPPHKEKTDCDVEIATTLMEVGHILPKPSNVLLFSGDGDFSYTLARLRSLGCRVFVVSIGDKHSFTSRRLKESCDVFIDLEEFSTFGDFGRE